MTRPEDMLPQVSRDIWAQKYRLRNGAAGRPERSIAETQTRVAAAVAAGETPEQRDIWQGHFEAAMRDFAFIPAGRILAGAGSGRRVTLFNCFVMGEVADDMTAIFDSVKEAALTMQMGGGIGQDFSTLRPSGAIVEGVGADASGPVGFMDVWDAMCRTIMSAGARRGAMMGTLRCDHPDIEAFIDVKADPARLRMFNLSVLVTDAFVEAVRADRDWPLVFGGHTYRTIRARALWDRIMRATYAYAEPGVIFIDRINAENNLSYCETISATNPCGEQPLPPYGACLLGSINLAALVRDPFSPDARLDDARLEELVATAVRFLDNVVDISAYPLAEQRAEATRKRRIGLGVTGLADALIFCVLHYDSAGARETAADWMSRIQNAAYQASAKLAAEKGLFPLYDRDAILASPGVQRLAPETRALIERHGLRNGLLTSIAPTGTISLLAGNVSSGIEPVFSFSYRRRIRESGDTVREDQVEDYAYRQWSRQLGAQLGVNPGGDAQPLPDAFVTAEELTPDAHLAMQAALQPHVDSAISKTINCPRDLAFEAFQSIYLTAHASGLKGCTTFRPNDVTGAVLIADSPAASAANPASIMENNATLEAARAQQSVPAESGGRFDEACPECGGEGFISRDGCGFCSDCGYSRCG